MWSQKSSLLNFSVSASGTPLALHAFARHYNLQSVLRRRKSNPAAFYTTGAAAECRAFIPSHIEQAGSLFYVNSKIKYPRRAAMQMKRRLSKNPIALRGYEIHQFASTASIFNPSL
jgi:hypothetical protein